ncbi:MAG: proton-conducting transporter membrane subunit, partial [Nitrospirota bacterium]|nr:proton-conducting transporter membrane subunit [Nitrospirota bacterium]
APLYGLSTPTLHVVFAVGLFTAFLGASMMLTQNDIKKTLGYSTIGQMGYMIMECGLGAFALAVFHLIAHGLFKGTVFLNCGNVIHDARKEPRNPPQDEVEEKMEFSYVTWITGVVTTLVLPLIILLAIHGVLDIPLLDSQGVMILLFFSWVTSSQAILALYRMRAVASWKVAATMLLTLIVIVLTYLLAVESFTHFLYPDKAEVAFYYQAAALPGWLFDLVVAATALCIIMGWTFIYAKTHGQTLRVPEFVKIWQVRFYLLFVNRLYLDDFALRASRGFMRTARRLDNSRAFQYVSGLVAIVAALPLMVQADNPSIANIGIFFALAFLLPLFPLHGIYVAALTRPKGYLPVALAILLPAAGLFGVMGLLPVIPKDILRGVGIMALFGAVFGSFKALVQTRLAHVLAYAGLALFSILWWFLAESRTVAPQAAAYAVAVILATGGLFLALHYAKSRYGDLDTANIGGLGRAMPRFAVLLSLLIMAAMGLPPFGLFSGYVEMLLHPAVTMGGELVVVLVAWFAVSWYLFRLLQRVLFGPHRTDIVYEDLRNVEVVSLLMVVLVLAAIGLTPYGFFGADMLMELKQ